MLKIGLILLVILCFIIIVALIIQSFKFLRGVQKQEALEKDNSQSQSARRLHPKLQQKNQDKH